MVAALETPETDDRSSRLALAFRAALTALSEPGRVIGISPSCPTAPGLSPAATTLASVLVDADAPIWIAPPLGADATIAALRFETSSAPAETPERAAFLVGRWADLTEVAQSVAIGDAERPDRSATLIVEVDDLGELGDADGDDGGREDRSWRRAAFRGPGVDGERRLRIKGVDEAFWRFVAINAARFPLGVDMYLTAGARLVGLPRTTSATPLDASASEGDA